MRRPSGENAADRTRSGPERTAIGLAVAASQIRAVWSPRGGDDASPVGRERGGERGGVDILTLT